MTRRVVADLMAVLAEEASTCQQLLALCTEETRRLLEPRAAGDRLGALVEEKAALTEHLRGLRRRRNELLGCGSGPEALPPADRLDELARTADSKQRRALAQRRLALAEAAERLAEANRSSRDLAWLFFETSRSLLEALRPPAEPGPRPRLRAVALDYSA